MPRYRFQWSSLPSELLATLAERLDISVEEAPGVLRDRYGARPREAFVFDHWPALRDVWLADDARAARELALELRDLGLADPPDDLDRPDAVRDYLARVHNTRNLRRLVLPILYAAGDVAPVDAHPSDGGQDAATPDVLAVVNDWANKVADLGLGEVLRLRDPDGQERVRFEGTPTGLLRAHVRAPDGDSVLEGNRAGVGPLVVEALVRSGLQPAPGVAVEVSDAFGRPKTEHGAVLRVPTTGGELPGTEEGLRRRVIRFVAERTGRPAGDIKVDADGDIPFRAGSAALFVRANEDPARVVVFAPVLRGVRPSLELYEELNRLNGAGNLIFTVSDGVVSLRTGVPAEPLVAQHLEDAMSTMFSVIDRVDDLLQAKFGGARFFDSVPKPPRDEAPEPGGYL